MTIKRVSPEIKCFYFKELDSEECFTMSTSIEDPVYLKINSKDYNAIRLSGNTLVLIPELAMVFPVKATLSISR